MTSSSTPRRALLATLAAAALAAGSGASAVAQDAPKIAFSSTELSNPYTVIFSQLIQDWAKKGHFNMLPTVDSKSDPAQQITDFTTLLGAGVKGILVVAVDGKAVKVALERAQAKGVPVVAVDTGPSKGGGKVAITVTTSSVTLGERSCAYLGEALKGKGRVLEIQGRLNSQVGLDRSTGFQACMKDKYPGIKVVSKPGEWVQETATNAAQTVLSTDPDVNAIYLASDSAYLPGVLSVLKRLGKLKPGGEEGHIAVVGIDGSPFALEQVRAGTVDAVISQPMVGYARYGLQYLKEAMEGKTFAPGRTDHDSQIVVDASGNLADVLNPETVTKANAGDPGLWGNQKVTN